MNDSSEFSTDELDGLQNGLSQQFAAHVSIEPIYQREMGDAALLVCQMSYRRPGEDSGPGRRVAQTCVILKEASLDLPQFLLAPQATGLLGKLVGLLASFGEVTFPESPAFVQQYRVIGTLESAIQKLFTRELCSYLQEEPGWSVRGEGDRLVIFHENHIVPDDELDDFVGESLRILGLFRAGEEELDAHPEIRRQATTNDMVEATNRFGGVMGGIVGERIRVQLQKLAITSEELESFAGSVSPREIPSGLKRQVVGENLPVVFIGFLFLIVGLVAGGGLLFMGKGSDRYFGLPFLIMFPLIGGLMAFGTMAYRRRKIRLLREGVLMPATVRRIEDSNILTNGQMPQFVTLIYSVDGIEISTSTMVYGEHANKARELQGTNTPARILVDPLESTHIVCIDFLTTLDR